jgi:hypothetical protein
MSSKAVSMIRCHLTEMLRFCDRYPVGMVLGTALLLRLFAVGFLGDFVYSMGGDGLRYLWLAQDILEGVPYGKVFGQPDRVPLYPGFLAAHLWLFGTRLIFVAFSQALLGAFTAVFLFWLARELSGQRRSWIVGLLWATYPPDIFNTVVLFPHILQVFLLTAAFLLVVVGTRRRSLPICAGAAVCFAASCLTRSVHLLYLPLFAMTPLMMWRLRTPAGWRWKLVASALIVIIGVAGVGWWTARDFTKVYRLEFLVLNGHERNAVGLVLKPFESLHEKMATTLREQFRRREGTVCRLERRGCVNYANRRSNCWRRVGAQGVFFPVISKLDEPGHDPDAGLYKVAWPMPTVEERAPSVEERMLSGEAESISRSASTVEESAPSLEAEAVSTIDGWLAELDITTQVTRNSRLDIAGMKLRQVFSSPDGLSHLECQGMPSGFWATFQEQILSNPLQLVREVVRQPCMVGKVSVYIHHYLILALAIPGFLVLWTRGWFAISFLYVLFNLIAVIYGGNYGAHVDGVVTVPRYALVFMPMFVLSAGLLLVALGSYVGRTRTVRRPDETV